jgi:hypothetical protein
MMPLKKIRSGADWAGVGWPECRGAERCAVCARVSEQAAAKAANTTGNERMGEF